MVKKERQSELPFVAKVSGITKLIICVILGVMAFFVMLIKIDVVSSIIMSWDVFCISMIGFYWTLFFTTRSESLKSVVIRQDDDHKVIFLIVLIAVCFSLFGALALLTHNEGSFSKLVQTIVSLSPVFLSWFLLHSIFTIRYAHLYFGRNPGKKENDEGGIDFPEKPEPDYMDFAYFSFVIGMTFQVSDVQVKSKGIRRVVLMHSLIAFAFNTVIVALSISTIGNIMK